MAVRIQRLSAFCVLALAGCVADPSDGGELSAGDSAGEGTQGTTGTTSGSTAPTAASTTMTTGGDTEGTDSGAKFDLGAGTGSGGQGCETYSFVGELEPPEIMLVLDKSGSMWSFPPWEFQGQMVRRWRSLHITVDNLLMMYESQAYFGAELYPDRNADFDEDEECLADDPITAPAALGNRDEIMAAIPGIDEMLEGRTPTGDGVQKALAHLAAIRTDRRQAMILVADGDVSVSCGDPNDVNQVVQMLEAAADEGVYTYVVGVGAGTGLDAELNQYAVAGGQPLAGPDQFYNAQDGDALFDMMDTLVQGVLSCTVSLESITAYPELTRVEVDGMVWPQVTDCDGKDGWLYSNPFDEITLCGAACDDLKVNGQVDVTYQCPEG